MYNSSVKTVSPFTAVVNGYDRLLSILFGVIIVPLLFIIGFSAIQSDFERLKPLGSDRLGFSYFAVDESINIANQKQSSVRFESFGKSDLGGKGMILSPMIPGDIFMGASSDIDCDKSKAVAFDSTVYLSSDMVDTPPKLIWMICPDLLGDDFKNVSSMRVTLSVLVDYSGKALEVTIKDEKLISNSVKQIVLSSVKKSLFRPAQKNNKSVNCWVQVPLELEV